MFSWKKTQILACAVLSLAALSACQSLQPRNGRPGVSNSNSTPAQPPSFREVNNPRLDPFTEAQRTQEQQQLINNSAAEDQFANESQGAVPQRDIISPDDGGGVNSDTIGADGRRAFDQFPASNGVSQSAPLPRGLFQDPLAQGVNGSGDIVLDNEGSGRRVCNQGQGGCANQARCQGRGCNARRGLAVHGRRDIQ